MVAERGISMKTSWKAFPALLLIPALFLFFGIAFAQAQQEQAPPLKRPAKTQKARAHEKAPAGAELGFGKAESLSGALTMVDSAGKLVVVMSANGVPFDFQVTPKTRIVVGGKATTLADLEGQIHKDVLVDFTPERTGNVAQQIKVAGG
jgi:hypothetical protein